MFSQIPVEYDREELMTATKKKSIRQLRNTSLFNENVSSVKHTAPYNMGNNE